MTHRERMITALNLGVPDRFIEQGTVAQQLADCGLTPSAVASAVAARLAQ